MTTGNPIIICSYCETNPSNDSEHIFPKSLGGEAIFIDCVCDPCNNMFSAIERELFQKSVIGLMRSSEGLEGYSKNKRRPAPLKFQEIFQFDTEEKIVYEVGVHNGFKAYFRPQIIQIRGKFYSEGPSKEEVISFIDAFNEWRFKNLILVIAFPKSKGDPYKAIKFTLEGHKYIPSEIELNKIKKEIIHNSLLKDYDAFKEHFEPRLLYDDSNNLLIRSRSIDESVEFLNKLLDYVNQDSPHPTFRSYSKKNKKDAIRVTLKFDMVKMQRALVKIGLNCLMHYYPTTKNDPLLRPAKDFVTQAKAIKTAIDPKNDLLDTNPAIHVVLFYQLKQGLLVRTNLFGGAFVYSFLVENLNLFPGHGIFAGLEVDYKLSKQKHFNMDDFLLNRIQEMGWINPNDQPFDI